MRLHNLYPYKEEKKSRKRIGRGVGSGRGGTSTKGHKGQNARSGGGVRPGFEGGQMPIHRRLPKHGFNNANFKQVFTVINIADLLELFPEQNSVSLQDIYNRGIAKENTLVKLLATGEVARAISVEVHAASAEASNKIAKAGGSVTCLLNK